MSCHDFLSASAKTGHDGRCAAGTTRAVRATRLKLEAPVRQVVSRPPGRVVSPPKAASWPALLLLALAAMLTVGATKANAQTSLLVQGVADLELWKTDAGSALLARNEGRFAPLARAHLWTALELPGSLTLYAMGEAEGGPAEEHTELELELAGVRWARSRALVADAGMITSPVGVFAGRRLSNRNALVGAPDAYPVTYPLGAQLSGAMGMVDWRAAMVSLPMTNEEYTPEPSARWRPAAGIGVSPLTGLRIGASWTAGSYLADDRPTLAGRPWHGYEQQVLAFDFTASRGYLELWAEAAHSAYEVPGYADPVKGTAAYVEARWTFTPRLYAAARAERNDYPFIEQLTDSSFSATTTDLRDIEAGFGFRPAASQLVKLTWRRDSWHVAPEVRPFLPDGYAVALQFSQSFDVMDLVDRARR